ncbi:ADP-ribosylglycohydrolase family protein [Streptomyces clavuligerus]|nr:ADP-ribosylglycohydrolase family protein [Streptomyces clavuligerus]
MAADAPGERPLPARALASSLPPGTASGGRQVPAPAGEVAGAGGHVPPEGPGAVPPRGGGDTSTPPHGHPVPAGTATAPGPSAHSRTGTAREAHDTTTPPHGHPVPAGADAPGGPGNREHGHAPPPWEGVRAPRRTTTAPLPEPTVPGPGQVGPPLPEQPQPHPGGPPGDRPGHRTDDGPDDGCAGADGTGCAHGGAGYTAALHAAWLGRAVGCLLGKPVEKLPLQGIRAIGRATGNWPLTTWFTARGLPADVARAHPFNRRSAPTSLAENIDGMPEDDDLDYPLLNLLLLQRHGQDFHTTDVARLWLDELPAGRTFTAERIAYRNLLSGVEPPLTARVHNPFREWIGAAIRADVHGWTHPGDPGAAAAQAHRDAVLSHTASGVHGAMFLAAVIASAAGGGHDVHRALAEGLRVVPPGSRLARAVRFGVGQARAETCFDTVVDRLHTAYGHYHWVHTVPNAALLAAALTHADGDFSGSICRAVSGGWDTDSNGATAGSIAGLLARRPDALPERWTAPLKNRLATSVAGFSGVGGVGFDTLARLTHREACRP